MAATVEAVIVSGSRKGDLVALSERDVELIDVTNALRGAVDAANEMAAEAKALRLQTESFVNRLKKRQEAR